MMLEPWQWVLALVGALAIGVAKTGIGGLGMLAVVVFANLLPAKQSAGFVLPMLIMADVIAVLAYQRHAQWRHLWRLFPWTVLGVLLGVMAMGRINNQQAAVLIGGIVLSLMVVHMVRRSGANKAEPEHARWFAPTIGILAGFTTLVANAAGPLMVIYLLAMRLPKMEYMGTGAYYFLLLNLFKVPFMIYLGLITPGSFTGNLLLAPAGLAGALIGKKILKHIEQRHFENITLVLAAIAGIRLLVF
ncbi:MAG: sulfite exporter TauE/SafE family protein [Cephaloticoccus sp.]|nr:sulfite exporter TauE/SafE family protein [Cephaloticoccus sp.]